MAKSIEMKNQTMMQDVVKIMAAICLIDHEKALEAMTIKAEMDTRRSSRFTSIVSVLKQESSQISLKVRDSRMDFLYVCYMVDFFTLKIGS